MKRPRYLLDTNICIHLLKGKFDVDKKIDLVGFDNCAISEITKLELLVGGEMSRQKGYHQNADRLNMFLDSIIVLPISQAIPLFAKEKVRLRLAGTPLDDNFDLLIGCTAIANDMVLVTENTRDFRHLQSMNIENWVERGE